jgi:predicted phage terminase large subunit-like protein
MRYLMPLLKTEAEYIAHQARLELARRSFRDYCILVHRGQWKPYAVHEKICAKLEDVESGKCKRLIMQIPPRHGKSRTVSETFPSYYISKHPDRKIILTSKDDLLATRFGLLNRRKVEEYGRDLFGVGIRLGSAAKTIWQLNKPHTGEVLSVPIMGGVTGSGANLMIIDDPVKNREEADSQTMRDKLWDEWQNTLRTRLEKDAAVIVIMTRWHEDDLAGRLLAQGGWELLSIPCIAEDNDPLGRAIGEPLCPELGFGVEWARQTEKDVGSRTWNALYQQRPAPQEGGMFKRNWFKRYDKLPDKIDEWTQSWDLAFKDNKDNDFVAGGVWARSGANHYLVAIIHERLDFVATCRKIELISRAYPQAVRKLVEEKANGAAIISQLRNRISGLIAINPKESKEARASAATPFFEAGNVYIPMGVAGDRYIEELVSFPNGKNDDQVDQTSQYLARFIVQRRVGVAVMN